MQNYIESVRSRSPITYCKPQYCTTDSEVFGINKSTVHKDVSERLPRINRDLAEMVRCILDKNKAERHIRGGEATRQKYASME